MKTKSFKKTVWIVIPTWNRCSDLIECLNSLNKITYPLIKIAVIDNASTDQTVTAVKNKFANVDVIELQENYGAPKASNIGFDYALNNGADYILRLDSDTIVSHDFLEPLIDLLESRLDVGVVGPKIYYYNPPDLIWYAGVNANRWNFGAIDKMHKKKDIDVITFDREVDYVWGAAMLFRRDVLELTKGFDPNFFIYYEEVDFCLRVKEKGYRLFYVDCSKVWHKVGTQNPTKWTGYNWNYSKAMLFKKYARNNFHQLALIIYSYGYLLFDAFLNFFKIRKWSRNRGPMKSALQGLNDAFMNNGRKDVESD